jgi:SAM-dependent methyltransferase
MTDPISTSAPRTSRRPASFRWATTTGPKSIRWPDEDESVDVIRASHVLEHFPTAQVPEVVKHWASKLKPGGVLKIAVPNFAYIAQAYLDGKELPIEGYTMGGQTDGDDFHKALFDAATLTDLFRGAGLVDIGPGIAMPRTARACRSRSTCGRSSRCAMVMPGLVQGRRGDVDAAARLHRQLHQLPHGAGKARHRGQPVHRRVLGPVPRTRPRNAACSEASMRS